MGDDQTRERFIVLHVNGHDTCYEVVEATTMHVAYETAMYNGDIVTLPLDASDVLVLRSALAAWDADKIDRVLD